MNFFNPEKLYRYSIDLFQLTFAMHMKKMMTPNISFFQLKKKINYKAIFYPKFAVSHLSNLFFVDKNFGPLFLSVR